MAGSIRFSELPTMPVSSLAEEDSVAVLDVSEDKVMRTSTLNHASSEDKFGAGTADKYGHVKLVDDPTTPDNNAGEALSAHGGYKLKSNIGAVEPTAIASSAHAKDSFFVFIDKFVQCTANIGEGDTIAEGVNVTSKSIGDTFTEFKQTFQAGVDAVYSACVAVGIIPASSTPKDIANAVSNAGSGNATAANILKPKTAFASHQLLTGTMEDRGAGGTSLDPGYEYIIQQGYYNGSGKVVANANTQPYTVPDSASGNLDLGEHNLIRYVNADHFGQVKYESGSSAESTHRIYIQVDINPAGNSTVVLTFDPDTAPHVLCSLNTPSTRYWHFWDFAVSTKNGVRWLP